MGKRETKATRILRGRLVKERQLTERRICQLEQEGLLQVHQHV
jgi:hypothetical protein